MKRILKALAVSLAYTLLVSCNSSMSAAEVEQLVDPAIAKPSIANLLAPTK